jgi:shikimate kinase
MAEKVIQFATALSTALTAIVSKKINLDGTTYVALSTIVTLVVSYVVMQIYEKFTFSSIDHLGYYNIFKIICIVIVLFIVYKNRWILKYFFDTIKMARYKEVDVVGTYPIEKMIKYMRQFSQFFKIQTGVCMIDLDIDYTKLRTKIFFTDTNFNVNGYLQFITEKTRLESSSDEKPKQPEAKPNTDPNTQAKEQSKEQSNTQAKVEVEKFAEYCVLKLSRCVCRDLNRCKNAYEYIDKIVNYQYSTDETYDISHDTYTIYGDAFLALKTYINTHKEFYQTTNVIITEMGDITKTIFFPSDVLICFNDSDKHVSGFIKWVRNKESHNDEIYMKKCHVTQGYSIYKYIDDIKKEITNKKAKRYLTLYNVDKTRNGYESVCSMFDGVSLETEELERIYIRTLFHPQIREIWNHIKMINYNPERITEFGQSPRMNLILYGPPGTGKSTFAYRIAMASKRHLMSVRLSRYTKNELYKIFTQPTINGASYKPKDIVYVLDEFDNDIEKIITKGTVEIERIENIKQVVNETFIQMERGGHMATTSSEPKKEGEQAKKAENEIMEMEKLVKGINSTYDKIEQLKDNIITIKDLLVIFQGSVPIDGCIIVAMTNNFNGMYEKCPALFRTGRLTPILFGNFGFEMIDEISCHYFGKHLQCKGDPSKFSIQPSTLISKILEIQLLDISQSAMYELFIKFINHDCNIEFS